MNLKTKYKLTYLLDKVPTDLVLEVELKQFDGLKKPFQNIWYGSALLNGQIFIKEDLSHCVDAKLVAERIGHKLRDEIKTKAKTDGKVFRVKKEEIK